MNTENRKPTFICKHGKLVFVLMSSGFPQSQSKKNGKRYSKTAILKSEMRF